MMTKRIIPCLDVRAGKVTKGVAFEGNVDVDTIDRIAAICKRVHGKKISYQELIACKGLNSIEEINA